MNEENTKDLTVDEKLDLLVSEVRRTNDRLSAITGVIQVNAAGTLSEVRRTNDRLSALEALVEDRLRDTRPLWQAIHAQTEMLVEQQAQTTEMLRQIKYQIEEIAVAHLELRGAQRDVLKRVIELERKVA